MAYTLEVRGVSLRFGGVRALTEVSFGVNEGELFSIIENGIRLTGMPAWGTGTPEGERESWALVHFIRRLPSLDTSEIERMEALNPQSPAKFREAEEAHRFLEGMSESPTHPAKPHHE